MPLVPADQPAALPTASSEDAWRHASGRTDVLRLRSLLPLGRLEFDLLVLIQRPVTGARDRGEVNEHVRRPVIGGDETKALIGVEPLHCSCCHQSKSLVRHATTRPRRTNREPTGPGPATPTPVMAFPSASPAPPAPTPCDAGQAALSPQRARAGITLPPALPEPPDRRKRPT